MGSEPPHLHNNFLIGLAASFGGASHYHDHSVAIFPGSLVGRRDRLWRAIQRKRGQTLSKRDTGSDRQWCVISNDGTKVVLACGDHSIEIPKPVDSEYVIRFEQLQPATFTGDRFLIPLLGEILLPE